MCDQPVPVVTFSFSGYRRTHWAQDMIATPFATISINTLSKLFVELPDSLHPFLLVSFLPNLFSTSTFNSCFKVIFSATVSMILPHYIPLHCIICSIRCVYHVHFSHNKVVDDLDLARENLAGHPGNMLTVARAIVDQFFSSTFLWISINDNPRTTGIMVI